MAPLLQARTPERGLQPGTSTQHPPPPSPWTLQKQAQFCCAAAGLASAKATIARKQTASK